MDGWNTIVSFWGPAYFQGLLLLVSGRVVDFDATCRYIHTWVAPSNCDVSADNPMTLHNLGSIPVGTKALVVQIPLLRP